MAEREEDVRGILQRSREFSSLLPRTRTPELSEDDSSSISSTSLFDASVSTLHIYAWGTSYSHPRPYAPPYTSAGTGTGFVIEHLGENYILTAAHVVESRHITVRFPSGDNTEYHAELVCLESSSDLALMKVTDPDFNSRAEPIPISDDDPSIGDDVAVIGFPVGGKTLSTAKGSISRTESTIGYAHSGIKLPAAQTSAPIAPGNSGGPVVREGELVGIAFQGLVGIDGGGQMIPASVVKHFLEHHKIFGKVDKSSFPELHITTKSLTSLEKEKIGIPTSITGVKITKVPETSDADGLLRPGDILCNLDTKDITDDGMVMLEDGRFEPFDVLIKRKLLMDHVVFTIIRDSDVFNIPVRLRSPHGSKDLVPRLPSYEQPSFYWDSGLLFQALTKNYSSNIFTNTKKMKKYLSSLQEEENEEVIFISTVFPSSFGIDKEGNKAYNSHASEFRNVRVEKINGQKINSIEDVINILQKTTSSTISIEFDDEDLGELIVPKASKSDNLEFLFNYSIACQSSSKHVGLIKGVSSDVLHLAQKTMEMEEKVETVLEERRRHEDMHLREVISPGESDGSREEYGYGRGAEYITRKIAKESKSRAPISSKEIACAGPIIYQREINKYKGTAERKRNRRYDEDNGEDYTNSRPAKRRARHV